jgi:hypothetical protein
MPNVGICIWVNVLLVLSQQGTRSSSISGAICVAFATCVVMHMRVDSCIRLSVKGMACFGSALVQGRVVGHMRLSEIDSQNVCTECSGLRVS